MTDLSITPANVIAGAAAKQEAGIAGATITAGMVVYLDTADSQYKIADSDSATELARLPRGIALNGASAGQPLVIARSGDVTIGATMSPGVTYYLSDEPGAIAPFADLATGDFPVSVGLAKTAAILTVNFAAATAAL
jgi:hypothetical protein